MLRKPSYNSGFCVTFFWGPRKINKMKQIYENNLFRGPRKIHKMMQVYVSNLQGARNYRTEKLIIEQGPNPRGIGIWRSTKVRYFTVLLYS
jgi:hypothetical protein